jgi:hypothetical protein
MRSAYVEQSMARKCIFAGYSPITPNTKSCAPEKMAMVAARNGNPGTLPPAKTYRMMTYERTTTPNSAAAKPAEFAAHRGQIEKPVIMSTACGESLRKP